MTEGLDIKVVDFKAGMVDVVLWAFLFSVSFFKAKST